MSAEQAVEFFRQTDLSYDVNDALSHVLELKPENPREVLAAYLARPRKVPTLAELYVASVSANSMQVAVVAVAMKIPFELKNIDLFKGEHKTPEYLAINHLGQLPGLRIADLGISMGESSAIMRCLANSFHVADHWYPMNPAGRARVDQYLDWRQTYFYPPASQWLYHCVGFGVFPQAVEKKATAIELMNQLLDVVVKDGFVNGAQASIADISIVSLLHFSVADPTFQMPESWALYWNRVKDAVGREQYDATYSILDGFVANQRERNASDPNFLQPAAPAEGA